MNARITPGSPLSRLLALAALAAAIVLLWEGLAQPVLDILTGNGSLAQTRHAGEELARIAERLPSLTKEKEALIATRPSAASGFLPGDDPRLAGAALAGRLNSEIKGLGGDLLSSETIDLKDDEGVGQVGLRLRVSLPQVDLPALLYRLEYSQPTLFIQTLSIAVEKDERLTIGLDLSGYLGGGEETASAADGDIPAGAFPDILTRPLFTPSRHLAVLRAASLASASLRLTGLVIEKGRTIALISPDHGHEVKIGPGASLNGWRVAGIDSKGIDLAKDGKRLRVSLKQPVPSAD